MAPKEGGLNQSETASGKSARVVWRFPCSSPTARDGQVIQRQHFCHRGGTICHPESSYVTTKLYGTSTCGCNNNAIFSDRVSWILAWSSGVNDNHSSKHSGGWKEIFGQVMAQAKQTVTWASPILCPHHTTVHPVCHCFLWTSSQ